MDIKRLKSFVAVASHLNFSTAARELNIVQPAISRHISLLEDELGLRLFERNKREVSLTAAGQQYLVDVKRILVQLELAEEAAQRADKGQLGKLRVGYLGSACLGFLAELMRQYRHSFPKVDIDLFEMTVSQMELALERNEIDVAFSRPLSERLKEKFSSETLYFDTLIAVVPKSHQLAGCQALTLSELKDEAMVLFSRQEAPGLFDRIISRCLENGFSPRVTLQPQQMQTVLIAVTANLGLSIVPNCVQGLNTRGCMFVPIIGMEPDIALELHFASGNPNPTVATFSSMVVRLKEDISIWQCSNDTQA